MTKTVIKYGLISGLISAVLMAITISFENDHMHYDYGYLIGYTGMLLSFIIIYPAMASYRDHVGGGQIKYGRALVIGLLITLVSSMIYAIAWVILYKTMMPDFLDKYAAHALDKMRLEHKSEAEIAKQAAMMQQYKDMYKNPVTMYLLTVMEPLPVGILVSVISAFIVRMKKKA